MSDAVAPVDLLGRAMAVVRCLEEAPAPLSRAEVADRTGLPLSTSNRIVARLLADGLLSSGEDGLRLGFRLFELGMTAAQNGVDLIDVASPHLQQLHAATGGTVQLACLDGVDVVYLAKIAGPRSPRVSTRVSGRHPATCTGAGKALLAWSEPETVDRVVEQRGLVRRTAHSIRDVDTLRSELARTRRRGFAADDEEYQTGLWGAAAPVLHGSRVIAAVTASRDDGPLPGPAVAEVVRIAKLVTGLTSARPVLQLRTP